MSPSIPLCRLGLVLCLLGLPFLVSPLGAATSTAEIVGLAGKCLDVRGSSTADGAEVVLFRCRDTANQRWDLPARGFSGEIVGFSGKCLDVRGGVAKNRARAEMRRCNGAPTQRWRLGQDGRIVGAAGLCLDVLQSSTADLAPIVVFACHGKANQTWRPRAENRFALTSLAAGANVEELWLDPGDPRILFASLFDAGLFRSEDGGASWSPLYDRFTPPSLFTRLESLNRTGQRILYGVRDSTQHLRSLDGGLSWQPLRRDFPIAALTADGRRTRHVWAATADGRIYLSADAGRSWQQQGQLPGDDTIHVGLFAVPGRSDHLIASSARRCGTRCTEPVGIFRSLDGGRSWEAALSGLVVVEVRFDPQNPDRMLARGEDSRLYRSRTGGAAWGEVTPPGADRVLGMVIDTRQAGRLLAATESTVYVSEDFGDSWEVRPVPFDLAGPTYLRPLAVAADGTLFANVTAGFTPRSPREGLYRSADFGRSWSQVGRGFTNAGIYGVVTTEVSEQVHAYGSSGLFLTTDGGTRWRQLRGGRHEALAVDPFDPQTLLGVEFPARLVRSSDGGATFVTGPSLGVSQLYQLAHDPTARGRVFFAALDGDTYRIYRSNDGGSSVQPVLAVNGIPQLSVGADGRVWVVTSAQAQVSADAGTTWQLASPCTDCLRRVAADRSVAGRVWAAANDRIWLSQDGGGSWRPVAGSDQPGTPDFIDELVAAEGEVVVRTNAGPVWRSTDSGASWSRLTAGLPGQVSGGLAIDGMHGGRVWVVADGLGVLVGDFSE